MMVMLDPTIVLVHLGGKPPKLLWRNIEWILNWFPKVRIVLAVDHYLKRQFVSENLDVLWLKPGAKAFQITQTPYSLHFRDGYWLNTVRRLGALADAHTFAGGAILHVETDMLLLPSFPFEMLSKSNTLAWAPLAKNLDMPGLLFSPSVHETDWLFEMVRKHTENPNPLTDMRALNEIAKEFPNRVTHLPVSPEMSLGPTSKVFGEYIFDPLPYGAWIAGHDPRNSWGWTKIGANYPDSQDVLVRPSKFLIQFRGREILIKDEGLTCTLSNLHIHSKSEIFFDPNLGLKRISKGIGSASFRGPYSVFKLRAFFQRLIQLLSDAKQWFRRLLG